MKRFKFSPKSLQRLSGVHEDLAKVAFKALEISKIDFGILQGLRTVEEQRALYNKGRTPESIAKGEKPVTWTMNSRHLSGHAIDFVCYVNGKVTWDHEFYDHVGAAFLEAGAKLGIPIIWGGTWKAPKTDKPHVELNKSFY